MSISLFGPTPPLTFSWRQTYIRCEVKIQLQLHPGEILLAEGSFFFCRFFFPAKKKMRVEKKCVFFFCVYPVKFQKAFSCYTTESAVSVVAKKAQLKSPSSPLVVAASTDTTAPLSASEKSVRFFFFVLYRSLVVWYLY